MFIEQLQNTTPSMFIEQLQNTTLSIRKPYLLYYIIYCNKVITAKLHQTIHPHTRFHSSHVQTFCTASMTVSEERERDAGKEEINRERDTKNGTTAMYSGDHLYECEWYRHTATVLYHMLASLPCTCALCAQCVG